MTTLLAVFQKKLMATPREAFWGHDKLKGGRGV